MTQKLTLINALTGDEIHLENYVVIVAGYTGRDEEAVQHHIDELAAIGIAPPPEVPMFYTMPHNAVSTVKDHQVQGSFTSGEVEPVYIYHNGQFYLGVGSDHTDRELEAKDIGESKRACPKPISVTVFPFRNLDDMSLDEYKAHCWVDGELYQSGKLNNLRTPKNILSLLADRLSVQETNYICFGGTLPLINGSFLPGREWKVEIESPEGMKVTHNYSIHN